MKKTKLSLMLSGVLLVSLSLVLVGCGGGGDKPADAGTTTPGTPVVNSDFPTKAIEVIIPFSPGGITDLTTRLVAQHIHKYLPDGNKGVVVVNKPGGGGILAMSEIVSSEADGYTLGVMSNGIVATAPLQQEVNYDFDDIDFLMHFYTMPSMVNVAKNSKYQTAEELIEYVKNNPGKLKLGILGVGNAQHIAWLKLCKQINSSITVVPFKGTTDALTALQQGMIDACHAYPMGDQKDGVLQLWAFSTKAPIFFPSAKTITELGYPEALTDMFFFFVAPDGIPADRRTIILDALKATLEDPEVIASMKNMEVDAYYESGEWVEKSLRAERESSKPFLEELGLLKEQQAAAQK